MKMAALPSLLIPIQRLGLASLPVAASKLARTRDWKKRIVTGVLIPKVKSNLWTRVVVVAV